MEQRKAHLTERIIATVRELSEEQATEVLDFASYLHTKRELQHPQRGSAEAILQVLNNGGALQFAPGELDSILEEIDHTRDTDRGIDG
jgi:hypothetical protein